MSGLEKKRREQFRLYLDISDSGGLAPEWVRVKLGECFELEANAQAFWRDDPERNAPLCLISGYQPRLKQEIALYEGDPAYEFALERLWRLPLGLEAAVPALLVFGAPERAWRVEDCALIPGALDAVRGRISFTLAPGGEICRGRCLFEGDAVKFIAE